MELILPSMLLFSIIIMLFSEYEQINYLNFSRRLYREILWYENKLIIDDGIEIRNFKRRYDDTFPRYNGLFNATYTVSSFSYDIYVDNVKMEHIEVYTESLRRSSNFDKVRKVEKFNPIGNYHRKKIINWVN